MVCMQFNETETVPPDGLLTSMRDSRMPTNVGTKGDEGMKLTLLCVVEAQHIMQQTCLQERGELQTTKPSRKGKLVSS